MVRFKNRYIVLKVDNGKDITQPLKLTSTDFYNELIDIVQYMHGDVGSALIKPGIIVKYCNELTKVVIVRARHGPHKLIASVLPFLKKIKDISASVKLIYVGATLRNCYQVLLKHQQAELLKIAQYLNSDEERDLLKSKVLELKGFDISEATS